MRKLISITAAIIIATNLAFSQGTAINTNGAPAHNSAILDLSSSSKGLRITRVGLTDTSSAVTPINNPANGLLVFDTLTGATGSGINPGFYYWDAAKTQWIQLATATGFSGGSSGPGGFQGSKRMFATSTTQTGNLGGLSGADALCQSRASAASLTGTWLAFLCTSSSNAVSRVTPNNIYVNMKGDLLSSNSFVDVINNASISMFLYRSVLYNEFGTKISVGDYDVWTGCDINGNKQPWCVSSTCSDWTSNGWDAAKICSQAIGGYKGISIENGSRALGGGGPDNCGQSFKIYCFEQ